MGRGRAKAKQTKVARRLKYYSPDTDLTALERELSAASDGFDMAADDTVDASDGTLVDTEDDVDSTDGYHPGPGRDAEDDRWASGGR